MSSWYAQSMVANGQVTPVVSNAQSTGPTVGNSSVDPGSAVSIAQPSASSGGGPTLALGMIVLLLIGIRVLIEWGVKPGE